MNDRMIRATRRRGHGLPRASALRVPRVPRVRRVLPALAALAGLAGLAGCAGLGAQPWEREILAQPGMQIDPDVIVTALDEHITFSKEASTGGMGAAGGGCGCN